MRNVKKNERKMFFFAREGDCGRTAAIMPSAIAFHAPRPVTPCAKTWA
jgi:hypothetical protein